MICNSCNNDKPFTDFTLKSKPEQIFYKKCKQCRSVETQLWYEKNKTTILKKIADKTKILKNYVLFVLNNSVCADCGCNDNRVLEFDHLRDKKNDINVLINRCVSLDTLKSEIEKCEVVCRNCHTIRERHKDTNYRT
jgi:hypothetical protein